MNKILYFILFLLFNLLLLSCESFEKGLGYKKSPPDEFLVEKRSSILLPPDYDLIPPDSKAQKDSKNQDLKSIIDNEIKFKKKVEDDTLDINQKKSNTENEVLKVIR